jgi:uncharacterized membrane protein YqjE
MDKGDVGIIAFILLISVLTISIIVGIVFWEMYRFNECKKVGHGTFYCLIGN